MTEDHSVRHRFSAFLQVMSRFSVPSCTMFVFNFLPEMILHDVILTYFIFHPQSEMFTMLTWDRANCRDI